MLFEKILKRISEKSYIENSCSKNRRCRFGHRNEDGNKDLLNLKTEINSIVITYFIISEQLSRRQNSSIMLRFIGVLNEKSGIVGEHSLGKQKNKIFPSLSYFFVVLYFSFF